VTLTTSLFLRVISVFRYPMCQGLIGKEYFREQLRYHKKRFARCRKNKRAFNKIVKKCEFFERHAQSFGVAVTFDKDKKVFKSIKIKVEDLDEEVFVPVTFGYFPKRGSRSHAEQA
jgi:hypothetical protein